MKVFTNLLCWLIWPNQPVFDCCSFQSTDEPVNVSYPWKRDLRKPHGISLFSNSGVGLTNNINWCFLWSPDVSSHVRPPSRRDVVFFRNYLVSHDSTCFASLRLPWHSNKDTRALLVRSVSFVTATWPFGGKVSWPGIWSEIHVHLICCRQIWINRSSHRQMNPVSATLAMKCVLLIVCGLRLNRHIFTVIGSVEKRIIFSFEQFICDDSYESISWNEFSKIILHCVCAKSMSAPNRWFSGNNNFIGSSAESYGAAFVFSVIVCDAISSFAWCFLSVLAAWCLSAFSQ